MRNAKCSTVDAESSAALLAGSVGAPNKRQASGLPVPPALLLEDCVLQSLPDVAASNVKCWVVQV